MCKGIRKCNKKECDIYKVKQRSLL